MTPGRGETTRDVLGALVPSIYPSAVSAAYLLCRDAQQAEDLVQEALVQALRRPPEPLDAPTLKAWLRPVVFRLYLRQRSRLLRETSLLRLRHHAEPPEVSEPTDALLAALGALSPKQRACVVLRYLEDLPEEEVARVLGMRPGTVKAHLAQGRQRLRDHLGAARTPGTTTAGRQP